jgi:hypothetical protein
MSNKFDFFLRMRNIHEKSYAAKIREMLKRGVTSCSKNFLSLRFYIFLSNNCGKRPGIQEFGRQCFCILVS